MRIQIYEGLHALMLLAAHKQALVSPPALFGWPDPLRELSNVRMPVETDRQHPLMKKESVMKWIVLITVLNIHQHPVGITSLNQYATIDACQAAAADFRQLQPDEKGIYRCVAIVPEQSKTLRFQEGTWQ